ncbi:MAG: DUF4255 domain-containing protein [Oscillospiraceae bacterium]|nr:DUF4255 domain-containing protein [Oscillospiraceae bacterium]
MKKIEQSLTELFSRSLSDMFPGSGRVGICTPDEPRDLMLGLYLYSIRPCYDITPQPLIQKGSGFREQAPQFLTLYYLLTAYSKAEDAHKTQEEHNILFRAVETLMNTPVLTERELGFRPGTYVDRLQLRMQDLTPEEMSNIQSYRESPPTLSVGFYVTPVEVSAAAGEAVSGTSSSNIQTSQKPQGKEL